MAQQQTAGTPGTAPAPQQQHPTPSQQQGGTVSAGQMAASQLPAQPVFRDWAAI